MMNKFLEHILNYEVVGIACYRGEIDLIRIGFGVKDIGDNKIIAKYEMHIQTDCRLIVDNKIMFAMSMIYLDSDGTVFNRQVGAWSRGNLPLRVEKFELNELGDLQLYFGKNIQLQIINAYTESDDRELWRILEVDSKDNHQVIIDNHCRITNEFDEL